MNVFAQKLVHVYFHGTGVKQLVGRLLLKDRTIFFEYDSEFIKMNLELSPFKLPLTTGVIKSQDRTFDGLFGLFNDSLPDGWGRLLLDRKLISSGINPHILSPLDRLCFIGHIGMGALTYEPDNLNATKSLAFTLDEIEREIQATLKSDDSYVDELITLGGSSAGARPKILVHIDTADWLIKFRSNLDPEDISAIEYTYHLLAKEAGLIVPEAKLFPSRKGLGYFGVKRFDREGDKRIHMHSIAGLLHADHREPSLDYESIMKATLYLTKDIRQCEIQFRHAVFNVMSHNRDDHSKNLSFLMDSQGQWTVSPSYDLTYSSGPGGEHSTMMMGEGKNPTQAHLLRLAKVGNIPENKARDIIAQVTDALQQWQALSQHMGVSQKHKKLIGQALNAIRQRI